MNEAKEVEKGMNLEEGANMSARVDRRMIMDQGLKMEMETETEI